MASILEFRLPADQFALAATVETGPDVQLAIERFVAHEPDSAMPYAWVTTDDFDAFEQAITDDATVADFSLLTEDTEERLYYMEWIVAVEDVLHLLLTEGCAVTSATLDTSSNAWALQLMAPEHGALSRVHDFCEENGVSLTMDAIYELGGNESSQHGLTETQYTSLTTASESG